MAAYRKVSVTFWADPFIQSLTPEGKYFYLYLMTNTRTTQCGIYEITVNQICFETGYNPETVNKLIAQFEKLGKIKYSKNTNEIALKNWSKYNYSDSPKVLKCIENELVGIKNRVLIQYVYSMYTDTQEAKEETKAKEETEEQAEVIIWPSFNDFWDKYDKKEDRVKCEKKFQKINQGSREKIMQHLEAYILSTPDKQYRKNPITYLNNQAWENEVIFKSNGNGQTKHEQRTASLIEDFAKRNGSMPNSG